MSVSRLITSMTFATLGLIFAAVAGLSLLVSVNFLFDSMYRQAAFAAVAGLFVIFLLLTLLHRTRRGAAVAWLASGTVPRALSIMLGVFVVVLGIAGIGIVALADPALRHGFQGLALALVTAVTALLMVTTLIYPGFAYDPYRFEPDSFYEPEPFSLTRFFGFLDLQDRFEPGRLQTAMAELGAIGFFGITILGWYGARYAPFLSSPEALEWLDAYGLILSLGTFVVLGMTIFLYPTVTGRWLYAYRVPLKIALIAMMALPAWYAPAALTRGLPSLGATFAGIQAGTAEVVLVAPIAVERDRGCDRAALAMPVYPGAKEVEICAIPEEIWNELSAGDSLLLSGWKTDWGLQYLAYALNR